MPIYAPVIAIKAGHIASFLATTAPDGYVVANGGLLSRAAYPALWLFAQDSGLLAATDAAWTEGQYSVGDGSTTFRIPDLRGNFPRFADGGRGVDAGRTVGSSQADQNKSHSHGVNDPGHTHTYKTFGIANNGLTGNAYTNTDWGYANSGSTATGISINSDGGTETRPRNIALLPCIKT